MRSIVFLFAVFCVGTVLTESLAMAYLWFNGKLTATAVQDIRIALGAEEAELPDEDAARKAIEKSNADIVRMRVERGWDLQRRLQEVRILNAMTTETATTLKDDKDKLEQIQINLQKRLAEMRVKLNGEAAEQTRTILLKMEPADAVSNLMGLSLEQNVLLLKGMPEKTIAIILQEFLRGIDPKRIERGKKIFEAISNGQPSRKLIDRVAQETGGPKPATPAPAN